jgi:hypothetical protein
LVAGHVPERVGGTGGLHLHQDRCRFRRIELTDDLAAKLGMRARERARGSCRRDGSEHIGPMMERHSGDEMSEFAGAEAMHPGGSGAKLKSMPTSCSDVQITPVDQLRLYVPCESAKAKTSQE